MTERLRDPESGVLTPVTVEVYDDIVLFNVDHDDDGPFALVEVIDGKLAIEVLGERKEWDLP